MLKRIIILMIWISIIGPVLAQEPPPFARENRAQYMGIGVTLAIPTGEELITRAGTLVSPSGLILTGLDALLDAELNFACADDDHRQIFVTLSIDTMAIYHACVVMENFDHNFALLQIEAHNDGTPVGDLSLPMKPLAFDEEYHLVTGYPIYSVMTKNRLSFEAATIRAVQLVESRDSGLKHADYFVELREIKDPLIGSPVVSEDGILIGITTQRSIDANQTNQQLVRVVPFATICRVAAEVCDVIRPQDGLPPDDRTQIPSNATHIETVVLDMEARAEEVCKRYGLVGRLSETDSGWGCWKDSDNSFVRDITVAQVDDYCKEMANNMDAFALLSGSDAEKAYQWECYVPDN